MRKTFTFITAALAITAFAAPTIARAGDTDHVLIVDGTPHNSFQVSGSVIMWNTSDTNPTTASFDERDQTWNAADGKYGADLLPCEFGIHWVSNDNNLVISNCLDGPSDTTVPDETTAPTTTAAATTTTSVIRCSTDSIPPIGVEACPTTTTSTSTTVAGVAPTTTTRPATTTTTIHTTTHLPATGSRSSDLAGVGLLVLMIGTGLVLIRRKRLI